VGDTSDGFPGIRGWGEKKSRSHALSRYLHLENIPKDWREWDPAIWKAKSLSETLFNAWEEALLFRTLATLRLDVAVFETVGELRWNGPRSDFEEHCRRMKATELFARACQAGRSPSKLQAGT